MPTPLIIPAKRRVHRQRRRVQSAPTPPAVLTLVGATYEPVGTFLTLAFDRPIDIAGIDPETFTVNDAVYTSNLLLGDVGGASLVSPTTVRIALVAVDDSSGSVVTLAAGAGNGIVAVGAGGTWAGVGSLELPFP